MSAKVATWSARVDRQEEVLNSLCELQSRRAVALQQFYDVLTQLETASVPPPSSTPENSQTATANA